ncbi:BGTF surface domain-containing protein [Natrinema sp. 1APR25-10V2]|uniref:BGTF surface domain-containing protein n=1 Tax=Natrinema sp. 1APR25-10V2 TaxID=2951081 RepID=UPI002874F04B|nr:BGTF surface domain-containing protein [Natrinema sp. 1APR25-10V2]MDS0475669.1 surface glycoprotein [Natrinema sp. 1APR25-10V2]
MTSETTYREKGRAVVLAALMVLSVVAMSAAFAGGAAAKQPTNATSDVQYTTSTSLNGDDLWIGQEVTVGDSSAAGSNGSGYINGSGFEIYKGLSSSSDPAQVTTVRVENGEATFDITSNNFEVGEAYHIKSSDNVWNNVEFWVNSENLNVDFARDSVSTNGQVTVDFESEREDQWVNVTAKNLDAEQLGKVFSGVNSETNDGTLALNVSGVTDGSAELTADFNNADVEAGTYNLTFDVTDSAASDNASITVTDQRIDYSFVDVDSPAQGEVANITVDVSGGDSAVITLGDKADGYDSYVNLTDIQNDELILQFDTHDASGSPWSLNDTDAATLSDSDVSTKLGSNAAFPVYTWDLSIGQGLNATGSSANEMSYDVQDEHDRGRLAVQERTEIGDVTTHTAPADATLKSLEDFEDATITQTSTIAEEDHLAVKVDDFGAEGLVEDIANNADTNGLSAALDAEGVYVEISEQSAGPIGQPTSWNTSTSATNQLALTGITVDEYSGDLIFVIDDASTSLKAGQTYDFTFNVTQENAYVSKESEVITKQSELTIEDREVEWDDISSLPAAEDATATGTTTVAPGTELSAEADSPNDQGGFVQVAEAVVTAGEDGNHQFAAEFDLSEEEPGVTFSLYAEDTVDSNVNDELTGVTLTKAGDQPESTIDVSGDAPSTVEKGADATLDVTVTNNGDAEASVDPVVLINGEDVSEKGNVTIAAGGEWTKSYTLDTSATGDISWEVTAGGASDSGTVTVEKAGNETGDDSSDSSSSDSSSSDSSSSDSSSSDGDDGDTDGSSGTPGFGVGVALVALLGAAMLALRRQD